MQTLPVAIADWIVLVPVLLPLFGAALLLVLRNWRVLHLPLALAVVLLVLGAELGMLDRLWPVPGALPPAPLATTMGNWLPPFGISFAVDLLGAGFALVAGLVALVALIVGDRDLSARARRDGFYPLTLLLLAGVSGAFLTGDLFNLYVWFEVMLVASFGLLALGREPVQLDGTVKYGFPNFIATSIFLLALGLVYGLLGTLNMADLIRTGAAADPGPLLAIAALLLLAFGMKAASFPVNGWLPASYHTPAPAISALLAALLTKVGIYALLRVALLFPLSFASLGPVVGLAAVATLLVGALGALAETGLRRALGFLLIGGIGAGLSGLAIGGADGFAGTIAYSLAAMLSMGVLYLLAGEVERATGASDIRQMGGLAQTRPILALGTLALLLAISGVPPFLGFWPKLLLVRAGLAQWFAGGSWLSLALWVTLLLNAFVSLIAVSRLFAFIFWRTPQGGDAGPAPVDKAGRRGVEIILTIAVLAVLALGLWPEPLLGLARFAALTLDAAAYGRVAP